MTDRSFSGYLLEIIALCPHCFEGFVGSLTLIRISMAYESLVSVLSKYSLVLEYIRQAAIKLHIVWRASF
jgi:hypothetical protein